MEWFCVDADLQYVESLTFTSDVTNPSCVPVQQVDSWGIPYNRWCGLCMLANACTNGVGLIWHITMKDGYCPSGGAGVLTGHGYQERGGGEHFYADQLFTVQANVKSCDFKFIGGCWNNNNEPFVFETCKFNVVARSETPPPPE